MGDEANGQKKDKDKKGTEDKGKSKMERTESAINEGEIGSRRKKKEHRF